MKEKEGENRKKRRGQRRKGEWRPTGRGGGKEEKAGEGRDRIGRGGKCTIQSPEDVYNVMQPLSLSIYKFFKPS